MNPITRVCCFVTSLCVYAFQVGAQTTDPEGDARIRLGPLALTPTIGLTNVGVDTNVFNQVEDPKKDFTATVTPQVQAWLRMGRSRVSSKNRLDLVYYSRYSTERSLNTSGEFQWEIPLNRFTPFVSDSLANTRERPGYEIDARARHLENTFTLGTDVKLGARTGLQVSAHRTHVKFDADAVFQGSYLGEVLNRKEDGLRATVRYQLTPLTTLQIRADAQTYRFASSSIRNADSVRIAPGVEFEPVALVSGTASIGFRKYDALTTGSLSYTGPVAAVDLGYTLLGRTRFSMQANRDIAHSFEPLEPIYLLTGFTGTVTHRLTTTWDVQGTTGRQRLDYRHVGTTLSELQRIEFVSIYGGGLGYRLGRETRAGLAIDHYGRTSDRHGRPYKTLRIGFSVTYGG